MNAKSIYDLSIYYLAALSCELIETLKYVRSTPLATNYDCIGSQVGYYYKKVSTSFVSFDFKILVTVVFLLRDLNVSKHVQNAQSVKSPISSYNGRP